MITKKIIFQFFIIFIFCLSCKKETYPTHFRIPENGLISFLKYNSNFKPMISAHRGGGDIKGYPENCIESFEFLSKQFPIMIECDIEMTKDSVLVMMHDNSLDRTTTGNGKIIEKTYNEIKDLKLKDNFGNLTNFKIPKLEDVLKWGRNKVLFDLDVKRNTPYEKVVELVEKMKAENYSVVIVYDAKDAKKVYDLNQSLMISVTIRDEKEYERHKNLGVPDKNMIAFIGTREPKKEFCDFLHQKKILTILGTLGNLDKMTTSKGDYLFKNWVENGADILSTDRPIEAYQVIK